MSQEGLLTEDEIKSYLAETFNLNLELDSITRPNREFVTDIYGRLLDSIYGTDQWKVTDKEDVPIEAIIVGRARQWISLFEIGLTFNYFDIITPTRKRTLAFFNVLIYISAKIEEIRAIFIQGEQQMLLRDERRSKIRKELADKKAAVEELLAEKGRLPPTSQIIAETEALSREFEVKKRGCDQLSEECRIIKNEIKLLNDKLRLQNETNSKVQEECEALERIRQLLENAKVWKDELLNLERERDIELNDLKQKKDKIKETDKIIVLQREFLHRLNSINDADRVKIVNNDLSYEMIDCSLPERLGTDYETLREVFGESSTLNRCIQLDLDVRNTKMRLDNQKLDAKMHSTDKKQTHELEIKEFMDEYENVEAQRRSMAKEKRALLKEWKERNIEERRFLEEMQQRHDINIALLEKAKLSGDNVDKRFVQIQTKVNSLMGVQPEEEAQLPAANRTYIKNSQ